MKIQLYILLLVTTLSLVLGGCGNLEKSHYITNPVNGKTIVGTKDEIEKEEANIEEQLKDDAQTQRERYNQKANKEYIYKIMEVSMTSYHTNAIYTDEYGRITSRIIDKVYSIGNPQEIKGNYLVIKYFDEKNEYATVYVVDKSLIDPSKVTSKDTTIKK